MTAADIRVLLVDDQDLIRTGFRLILSGEPGIRVLAEAGNGEQALQRLRESPEPIDVVLMDVRMPGMNGIEATERIAQEFPDTRVLVLTTFDLDEYALAAIQSGASGFLLKDAQPDELVRAIERVAAGDAAMAPSVTLRLLRHLSESAALGAQGTGFGSAGPVTHPGEKPVFSERREQSVPAATPQPHNPLAPLTDREREVFWAISDGLNNQEIGERLFLSESTVKTHVGRVLYKLELRDRVHAVILGHGPAAHLRPE